MVAYMDTPTRLVVEMSRLVKPDEVAAGRFTITDSQKKTQKPVATRILFHDKKLASNEIELNLSAPLDIAGRAYEVSVEGFGGRRGCCPAACWTMSMNSLTRRPCSVRRTTRTKPRSACSHQRPEQLQVVIYDSATGDKGRTSHDLHLAGKGIWEGKVDGDLDGKFYLFKLDDSDREILDIIVSMRSIAAGGRAYRPRENQPAELGRVKTGPPLDSPVDMVVYEMHVRDFTIAANSGVEYKGKYLGFAQTGTHLSDDQAIKTGLDNLTELGVTHVQLCRSRI